MEAVKNTYWKARAGQGRLMLGILMLAELGHSVDNLNLIQMNATQ
jgi:hypothetical protein